MKSRDQFKQPYALKAKTIVETSFRPTTVEGERSTFVQ